MVGPFLHVSPLPTPLSRAHTKLVGQGGVPWLHWTGGDGRARWGGALCPATQPGLIRLWAACETPRISFFRASMSSENEGRDHECLYQQRISFCFIDIRGPVVLSFPEKQPKNTAMESVLPTHNLIKNWKTS